jgi:hypothetical protein
VKARSQTGDKTLMLTKSVTLRDAFSFMRRVICYNQGEHAQYNFLAGELHKTLKDSLRESPGDVGNLRKHCDQLQDFLNSNLHRVSLENFEFIKEYFGGRHDIEPRPRLCIKGNYKKDGKYYVVQLIRDKKVNYPSEYPLEDNSGFLYVKNHGQYFICNNIPERIGTGKYHNARIDTELARAYYEKRSREPTTSSDKQSFQFDELWVKCWETPKHKDGVQIKLDPTSCYKSTVIIPMTLWNNKLNPTFLERMHVKAKEEGSKIIFGYLCFDHVEENYFDESDESIDINVGYIFADILSLYMITRFTYTGLSETFFKALKAIGASSEKEVVYEV